MDEKPKCSHDVEPIKQKPTQEDQSKVKKDHTTKKQSPETKTIEHQAHSEDQSITPIPLTVLTKDQPVFSRDQPSYSKDQPAFSKTRIVLTVNQPDVTKEEISFPAINTVSRKDVSLSTEEETVLSTIQIDSTKNESSSSKKETTPLTTIHMATTRDESVASRELIITPKIQIASAKGGSSLSKEQKALLKVEAASTTNDEEVFGKSEDVASMTNCPKCNVEYAMSLCAARLASGTPSYITNNGYILSANAPIRINSATQSLSTTVPHKPSVTDETEPPSLFLQALSKLNESSLTLAVISQFRIHSSTNMSQVFSVHSGELTPPDSLLSAPPTYSFVLRQIAVRRRPRFMGTFFSSPSFVQHSPPPTYTGAFDIYIEPALPPPPARVYTFGFTSMPVICPECGYAGMTVIKCHVTYCTHMCAFLLCLLCCWVCAPLPYVLRSCKDVYHYCRNCRSFLGMYCPNYHETGFQN